jgi:hypothetical protein
MQPALRTDPSRLLWAAPLNTSARVQEIIAAELLGPALGFRRGASRCASFGDLDCAFGTVFLRSCYH